MPEGELLPKGKTSKEWLAFADAEKTKFTDYHSKRKVENLFRLPAPLADDYSRILSNNELQARDKGMKYLRDEKAAAAVPKYRKGGRVKKSGPSELHAGEAVVRKTSRKKARANSR